MREQASDFLTDGRVSIREASTTSELVVMRLKRRTDVQSRLIDDETVVLDRRRELIHQFNRTATFIWQQCDGESTAAEITDRLCENFSVDESTAAREVLETLQRLHDLELVEATNDTTPRKEV